MRVRELIEKLKDENPEAEVQVYAGRPGETFPVGDAQRGSHLFEAGNEERDRTVFLVVH